MKLLGVWCAALLLAAAVHAEDVIKGELSSIDPAAGTLEISGVKITAGNAKVSWLIVPWSLEKLKPGDSVGVKGSFSGPLAFKARKVKKSVLSDHEIEASVSGVNAREKIVLVSGITIKIPSDTVIEDNDGVPLRLERIYPGNNVEIEGYWTAPGEFTAESVEVRYLSDIKREK